MGGVELCVFTASVLLHLLFMQGPDDIMFLSFAIYIHLEYCVVRDGYYTVCPLHHDSLYDSD